MLERKVIHKGQGFRLVTRLYVGGWRSYSNFTVVVRMPNRTRRTFLPRLVVTEGIQGQPQLTFDSYDAAIRWKELQADENLRNCTVGHTNKDYECIKVPLEGGGEGWLAVSNFPPEGDVESWSWLEQLFPDYFGTERLGFFNEAYTETEVTSGNSWKIKTGGEYYYTIKVLLPNTRSDRFKPSVIHCSPYGGPGYGQISFLTKEDAEEWLEGFLSTHPQYEDYGFYVYSARVNLRLVKIPLEDGTDVYVRKEYLPRENINPSWWERVREIYPDYFKTERLGFFNEDINLTEDYNVPHETFKRVIIKYVLDNGYIKGGWNGRYMTPSPTVEELNRLLRHTEDLTDHMCTPEQYTEFSNWVSTVQPEGPQADWIRNCLVSWNKTGNLTPADLKNLVSFVSFYDSNIKYQRRQQARIERERQHQERVAADTNTWAGEVGETVSLTVESRKPYSSTYGTMWTVVGTDGRTYTWGSEEEVEPGDHVTGKIRALSEFNGIKQTRLIHVKITRDTIGFFNESITTDWLFKNFDLTLEELKDLCWKNWEYEFEEIFDTWHDHYHVDVSNPFFDSEGIKEFDTLEESMEYYGGNFVRTWIRDFYFWCDQQGLIDHIHSKRKNIGFFK